MELKQLGRKKIIKYLCTRNPLKNNQYVLVKRNTNVACLSTRDGMHFNPKRVKCTTFEVVREFFSHHFIVRFTKMLKPLIQSMCVLKHSTKLKDKNSSRKKHSRPQT